MITSSNTYWKSSLESRYAYKKGIGTIQPSLFTALSFVNIGFYLSEIRARSFLLSSIGSNTMANPQEYSFGFNGQEKDNEWTGTEGSHLNYKYRVHDARIGRFLSIDPLTAKYPHNSPYAFSENRVIDGIELEGLEIAILPIYRPPGKTVVKVITNNRFTKGDGVYLYNSGSDNTNGPTIKEGTPFMMIDVQHLPNFMSRGTRRKIVARKAKVNQRLIKNPKTKAFVDASTDATERAQDFADYTNTVNSGANASNSNSDNDEQDSQKDKPKVEEYTFSFVQESGKHTGPLPTAAGNKYAHGGDTVTGTVNEDLEVTYKINYNNISHSENENTGNPK